MHYLERITKQGKEVRVGTDWRLTILLTFFLVFMVGLIARLFLLQIIKHDDYIALASGQSLSFREDDPLRGEIFIQENAKGGLVPIAENRKFWEIYAVPYEVENPAGAAGNLASLFELNEEDEIKLKARLGKGNDPYEPIENRVSDEIKKAIDSLELSGIYAREELYRYYPVTTLASHITGFLGYHEDGLVGNYGLEGYHEELLSGQKGFEEFSKAPRKNEESESSFKGAKDGSDIILTLDSVVQFKVCNLLEEAVDWSGSVGGTVILMESATGKIRAMCSAPSFDPNKYYDVENINVYNNPAVFEAYEPGSVFKSITMAAALNEGAVTPDTTYIDEGELKIASFTIRNSDQKAHGEVNMTSVLTNSLNLGAIFAGQQIDKRVFSDYIKAFGFGEVTNIPLSGERAGQVESVEKRGDIYAATASYGQGITATPIQLVTAYNAFARRGSYIGPSIVEKFVHRDGYEELPAPAVERQILTPKAASLISSMLVTVIEEGHAGTAGVEGYVLAGKTGTAQIAGARGKYLENEFNHTFIGYGPVENPFFTLLVKLDKPSSYEYSSGTAAPLFGQIAKFILQYYNIPPSK